MTLRSIITLICTDDYWICKGDQFEEIHTYEDGSYRAIKKYYDDEVIKIVPTDNEVEIHLK